MSLLVRTTPGADAQVGSIDAWWRINRPASPNLFADELAASFEVIGHTPNTVWSADGRTLYYLRSTEAGGSAVVAVEIIASPGPNAGKPR